MSQKWFSTTDENYPPLMEALMEALRYYFCNLFYSSLAYTYTSTNPDPIEKSKEEARLSGKNRFILTNIQDRALPDSAKVFQLSDSNLPFTAFQYSEDNLKPETFNAYAHLGLYYSFLFNCKFKTRPMKLVIPMISFFSTGYDYFRAITLLTDAAAYKNIINVPIVIHGITTTFPIVIEILSITKGQYAWDFAQQLNVGRIQDIQHDVTINFFDLTIDTNDIYPITDLIIFADLYQQYNGENIAPGVQSNDAYYMASGPSVSSTVPTNGASGVLLDANILINFAVAMNEESVENYIYINPFTSCDFVWNDASTSLIINPQEDLNSGTLYTVTINKNATTASFIDAEEDYELEFTTEV